MQLNQYEQELIQTRRHLHTIPEEGWTEFQTTAYLTQTLRQWGYQVLLGHQIIDENSCLGRCPQKVQNAIENARQHGVPTALLDEMQGLTGCVAILKTQKPGPTVAVRFDIDCVQVTESNDPKHVPSCQGFASTHPGLMHACGHDAHMSIGLALAHWAMENKEALCGTLKILFQPAEEGVRGAVGMANSGIVDDADFFLASHIAMMCKSGDVSVNPYGFLCTTKLDVAFEGLPAHAGVEPNKGHNAMAAACNSFVQLMGIARHGSGMTRINVGQLEAGEGRNVIPSHALMKLEVRGETAEINQYMFDRALKIIEGNALAQDCRFTVTKMGEAVDLQNDPELIELLTRAVTASGLQPLTDPINFGGSEDATILARRVQSHGGKAALFVLGSNIPSGHHTATFDIDEKSLLQGLTVWTQAVTQLMHDASQNA